jgi:hypothetical protein
LNISYPANGSQKLIDIEDERKLAVFMEKRVRRIPLHLERNLSRPVEPKRFIRTRGLEALANIWHVDGR